MNQLEATKIFSNLKASGPQDHQSQNVRLEKGHGSRDEFHPRSGDESRLRGAEGVDPSLNVRKHPSKTSRLLKIDGWYGSNA